MRTGYTLHRSINTISQIAQVVGVSFSLCLSLVVVGCKPQMAHDRLGTLAELVEKTSAWTRIREVPPDCIEASSGNGENQTKKHEEA